MFLPSSSDDLVWLRCSSKRSLPVASKSKLSLTRWSGSGRQFRVSSMVHTRLLHGVFCNSFGSFRFAPDFSEPPPTTTRLSCWTFPSCEERLYDKRTPKRTGTPLTWLASADVRMDAFRASQFRDDHKQANDPSPIDWSSDKRTYPSSQLCGHPRQLSAARQSGWTLTLESATHTKWHNHQLEF